MAPKHQYLTEEVDILAIQHKKKHLVRKLRIHINQNTKTHIQLITFTNRMRSEK